VGFRHILFNRVKSDAGFVVKIRTMSGFAEYREGDRIAIVPVQLVLGQALAHVNKDTRLKWKPPHDAEEITEDKRKEILKNVVEAMRFRKYSVDLV